MTHRATMPSGNVYTEYAIHIVKWYEGKGVLCLDARNKPLEWVAVTDIGKGRRVRDMINGALAGDPQYRKLNWSFLKEDVPQESAQPPSKPAKEEPVSAPPSQPKTTK
jgi:hypothetical protein